VSQRSVSRVLVVLTVRATRPSRSTFEPFMSLSLLQRTNPIALGVVFAFGEWCITAKQNQSACCLTVACETN